MAQGTFYINEPLTYRFHKTTGHEFNLASYFSSRWWRFGGTGRELAPLESDFAKHIESLSSGCVAKHETALIVKVPTTETLEFFVNQLRPDLIIYVRRRR